jgi:hypothetical protein
MHSALSKQRRRTSLLYINQRTITKNSYGSPHRRRRVWPQKEFFLSERSKKNNLLKYKKLIKLKRAYIALRKKIKISPKIFSKKNFVKTMHRKRFDYPDCGKIGIYPLKPIHIETSYRLMISIFLFTPQKLSLLSPFWEKTSL